MRIFSKIYKRACKAFPQPATGCIPMVMFPEVREFQTVKDQLSSPEKSERSTGIMADFQARGMIPGAYRSLWSTYQRRLRAYHNRRAAKTKAQG